MSIRYFNEDLIRKKTKRDALPKCEQLWTRPDEDTHIHQCRRFRGHRSAHKCNCGDSKHVINKYKLGGGKPRK